MGDLSESVQLPHVLASPEKSAVDNSEDEIWRRFSEKIPRLRAGLETQGRAKCADRRYALTRVPMFAPRSGLQHEDYFRP